MWKFLGGGSRESPYILRDSLGPPPYREYYSCSAAGPPTKSYDDDPTGDEPAAHDDDSAGDGPAHDESTGNKPTHSSREPVSN